MDQEEEEQDLGDFDIELGADSDVEPQDFHLEKEEQERLQNEILFAIQGVGQVKTINGMDVYVKDKYCEASLRDIIKYLRAENPAHPVTKLTLGKWRFLANDLVPLLIFHKKDKKLAFITCMIVAELTEYP